MDSDSASRRRSERARQTRDEEVEAILQAAGVPGLRVLTGGMYDTRELSFRRTATVTEVRPPFNIDDRNKKGN